MKHLLPFLFSLILLVSCNTEQSIKVNLEESYFTNRRLFELARPINAFHKKNIASKIIYPKLDANSDTSLIISDLNETDGALEDKIAILVEGIRSTHPTLFIDHNNNLDFTDDESLAFSEDSIDISFSRDNGTQVIHRWYKVPDSSRTNSDRIVASYLSKDKPYDDYFFKQELRMKAGDVAVANDSFRVGLYDMNNNGFFNDVNIDRLSVGEFGNKNLSTERYKGAQVLDSTNFFQGKNTAFQITEIDSLGDYLKIKKAYNEDLDNKISKGDQIPNYQLDMFNGDTVELTTLMQENEYLYLNFWAGWCVGCIEEIRDLKKLHKKHSNKIRIVGLNYNEGRKRATQFLQKYKIDWAIAESKKRINKDLNIYGLPRGVLVNRDLKILRMNIHPDDLIKKLEDGEL